MADIVNIIQEIRGTAFDVDGKPTNGMWFDVKGWHTSVEASNTIAKNKHFYGQVQEMALLR